MLATMNTTTEHPAPTDEMVITEIDSMWSEEVIDSIDTVRHQLLDEMERLTAGDVMTPLVRSLSGACLRGLHFVLTSEGTLAEVTEWFLEASALLEKAERIATPTATRLHCMPQAKTAVCQHGKKAA